MDGNPQGDSERISVAVISLIPHSHAGLAQQPLQTVFQRLGILRLAFPNHIDSPSQLDQFVLDFVISDDVLM